MFSRTVVVLLMWCLGSPLALAEATSAAKAADIRRLIEVTGGANLAKQFAAIMGQQMFVAMRKMRPDIPDRALAVAERELVGLLSEKISAPGGLTDQVMPIYDRYFTHQEIRDLLAFYQTPAGRKSVAMLPQVMNESALAGQRWAQALAPEMERRVMAAWQREGLLPKSK